MEINQIKKRGWILFIIAWLLIKFPFLFFQPNGLNGDVAIHLLMAKEWFQGGASKFMWGQGYLGTLESLWNALWFYVLPLHFPWYYLPNLILAAIADLLFLKFAQRFLSFRSILFLMIFLILSPWAVVEPQVHPCYSYTIVSIFVFLSFLLPAHFWKGFLLGLAFYTQPISLYFIFPFFAYYFFFRKWKNLIKLFLGFLIPLLFALLPVAGPAMDWGILFSTEGSRNIAGTTHLFLYYVNSLLGLSFIPVICGIIVLSFFIFLFSKLSGIKQDFQQMSESNRMFLWVMGISFFLIPFLFIFKRYGIVDDGIKRYLWLWHYPFYFGICYLFGKYETSFKKLGSIFFFLFWLMILGGQTLWIYSKIKPNVNPDQNLKSAIEYLRLKNMTGITGDYWAVYPIAFFSLLDGGDGLIKACPSYGIIRRSKWVMPVSSMPRIAYVCWKSDIWCQKDPPPQVNLGLNQYVPDSTEPLWQTGEGDENITIQIYERYF